MNEKEQHDIKKTEDVEQKHWTEILDEDDQEEAYIDQNYAMLNDKYYKEHPEDYHEEIFEDPLFWDYCHEEYEKAKAKISEVYE